MRPGADKAIGLRPVVLIAASVNTASLLSILHASRIHPVRQQLLLPPDAGFGTVFRTGTILLAVVLAVSLWVLTRPAGGRVAIDDHREDSTRRWQAWIPAAVAPVWLVVLVRHPNVTLLMVFSAILLTAWSLSRFIRVAIHARTSIRDRETGIETRAGVGIGSECDPAVRWWSDGWFFVVTALALALTLFHTYVQFRLYRSLQYGSPDIGYYAEMLTSVLRGRGLRCEAFGHDFFGEHFSPGLYLLVPVWACWPAIESLMFLGAAAVCSGALAVHALARAHGMSSPVAAIMAIAYLLYPSNSRVMYGASYGFHEILMVVPLMLWSIYHYRRRNWWAAGLLAILAVSFKENVAVVYGCFGLYVFACNRRSWWGLVLLMACLAYVGLVVGWIVPSFRGDHSYSKFYLYEGLGGTPSSILASFVHDPSRVLGRLCSWRALGYALSLCVPVGMMLLKRPVALVAVPTLAFTCLMDNPDFASIRFWHQTSALPILWLATIEAVALSGGNGSKRSRHACRAAAVLCCALLTHYGLGFSPVSRSWRDVPLAAGDRGVLIDRLHAMIPQSDTVQATPRLACHFYSQDRVYPVHATTLEPPDWILIDSQDTFSGPDDRARITALADALITHHSYAPVLHEGSVRVFRRRGTDLGDANSDKTVTPPVSLD